MTALELTLEIILVLIVNETCHASAWLACKLVRRAAYFQYRDPERAAIRAEEFAALINDRPGQLFKICTALILLISALATRSISRTPTHGRNVAAVVRRIRFGVENLKLLHRAKSEGKSYFVLILPDRRLVMEYDRNSRIDSELIWHMVIGAVGKGLPYRFLS
ncbi:hypothetical protein [[Actinomadura] parvosata]|uniref:hypothetical protein n=1 Tax=[Actinomadura] parvosata TaxID=1955412 RepID=UPI0012BBDD65|nr:hypothetical protein [Nonomuraea sp. ATCC 55076]